KETGPQYCCRSDLPGRIERWRLGRCAYADRAAPSPMGLLRGGRMSRGRFERGKEVAPQNPWCSRLPALRGAVPLPAAVVPVMSHRDWQQEPSTTTEILDLLTS